MWVSRVGVLRDDYLGCTGNPPPPHHESTTHQASNWFELLFICRPTHLISIYFLDNFHSTIVIDLWAIINGFQFTQEYDFWFYQIKNTCTVLDIYSNERLRVQTFVGYTIFPQLEFKFIPFISCLTHPHFWKKKSFFCNMFYKTFMRVITELYEPQAKL